ncbi:hypothetical protein BB559_004357 [Furculomyces boomerangus]|uniref:Uncharacterized protein n=2 Tax=Harpellales TaxID=61421 RepID=A0A2T9YF64_9FUNG|nr:hypothetical protein BB559_004357 [Furculomyces boomerangus]PVZ99887.1 hypothetical protein BB558_004082 [Smittium angustum]
MSKWNLPNGIGRDIFTPTNADIPGPGKYNVGQQEENPYRRYGFLSKSERFKHGKGEIDEDGNEFDDRNVFDLTKGLKPSERIRNENDQNSMKRPGSIQRFSTRYLKKARTDSIDEKLGNSYDNMKNVLKTGEKRQKYISLIHDDEKHLKIQVESKTSELTRIKQEFDDINRKLIKENEERHKKQLQEIDSKYMELMDIQLKEVETEKSKIKELGDLVLKYEEEIDSLHSQLEDHARDALYLEDEIKEYQLLIDSTRTNQETMNEKIKDIENELLSVKNDKQSVETNLFEKQTKIKELEDLLNSKDISHENEINKLKNQLQTEKLNSESAINRSHELIGKEDEKWRIKVEKIHIDHKAELAKLQDEMIETHKKEIQKIENIHYEKFKKQSLDNLYKIKEEIEAGKNEALETTIQLEKELNSTYNELEETKLQLDSSSKNNSDLHRKAQLNSEKDENKKAKAKITNLNNKLAKKNEEYKDLTDKLSESDIELRQFKENEKKLQQEKFDLSKENEVLLKEIEQERSITESLKNDKIALELENQEYANKISETSENNKLENEKLMAVIEEYELISQKTQDMISVKNKDLEQMKSNLFESLNKIESLKVEIQNLRKEKTQSETNIHQKIKTLLSKLKSELGIDSNGSQRRKTGSYKAFKLLETEHSKENNSDSEDFDSVLNQLISQIIILKQAIGCTDEYKSLAVDAVEQAERYKSNYEFIKEALFNTEASMNEMSSAMASLASNSSGNFKNYGLLINVFNFGQAYLKENYFEVFVELEKTILEFIYFSNTNPKTTKNNNSGLETNDNENQDNTENKIDIMHKILFRTDKSVMDVANTMLETMPNSLMETKMEILRLHLESIISMITVEKEDLDNSLQDKEFEQAINLNNKDVGLIRGGNDKSKGGKVNSGGYNKIAYVQNLKNKNLELVQTNKSLEKSLVLSMAKLANLEREFLSFKEVWFDQN